MLESLKNEVFKANLNLVESGLVTLTSGYISGIDRSEGLIVIKPSGVNYDNAQTDDMVVVDMEGRLVEGVLTQSSDMPTHIELYKNFPSIGGITHTHSENACIFAQAYKEIPCLGTTHADYFNGSIPLTRELREDEVINAYEANTGKVIVERFRNLEADEMPAVLVAGHGPFSWGKSAGESVKNSLVLERVAKMARGVIHISPEIRELAGYVLKKHYDRRHGAITYHGQR